MAASSEDSSIPAYDLLVSKKVPPKSVSQEMPPTKVLLDTGASVSLMPAWQAASLGLEVKPRRDISSAVRTANHWLSREPGRFGSGTHSPHSGKK